MNMFACGRATAFFQFRPRGLYDFLECFRATRYDRAIDKLPADPLPCEEIIQGLSKCRRLFYPYQKNLVGPVP